MDLLVEVFFLLDIADLDTISRTNLHMNRIIMTSGIVKSIQICMVQGNKMNQLVSKLPGLQSIHLTMMQPHIYYIPLYNSPLIPSSCSKLTELVIEAWKSKYIFFGSQPSPGGSVLVISEVFPLLKTLKFKGWIEQDGKVMRAFEKLPSSLTDLCIHSYKYVTYSSAFPDINHLTNLQSLHITPFNNIGSSKIFDSRNFPYLTSLRVPGLSDTLLMEQSDIKCLELSPEHSENLSPKLQMQCETIFVRFHNFDWASSSFRSSTRLTKIEVSKALNLQTVTNALPQTITWLKIQDVENFHPKDEILLLSIPHGITTLGITVRVSDNDLTYNQMDIIDQMVAEKARKAANKENFWFFDASSFESFGSCPPAIIEWLNVLPPSLRVYNRRISLTVKRLPSAGFIDFANKIPLLNTLYLTSKPSHRAPSEEELLSNDSSSQSCPIHSLHVCRNFTLPPLLKNLEIEISSTLLPIHVCHPSCTSSKVKAQSLFDAGSEPFPEALDYLSVREDLIPKRLTRLPSLLSHLELDFKTEAGMQITNIGGRAVSWGAATEDFERDLLMLSKNLHTLYLRSDRLIRDTKAFLTALPRTITMLTLPIIEKFGNEDVPLLPPKLVKLDVRHAETIDDDGYLLLPSTLTQVSFKLNRNLTPKILDFLPPSTLLLFIPRNSNFPKSLYRRITSLDEGRAHTRKLTIVTKRLKRIV